MSDLPTPKIEQILAKYGLDPLWLYQDTLIVEGLAHLEQHRFEQAELLLSCKLLERSQLKQEDLEFLKANAQNVQKQIEQSIEQPELEELPKELKVTQEPAQQRMGASKEDITEIAKENQAADAIPETTLTETEIPEEPDVQPNETVVQTVQVDAKEATKEIAADHPKPTPAPLPKITLSSDPFMAKAELLMHLCKMQSSWELASRELIKCLAHAGYKRGQLFFEPKAGQAIQMHWQQIGMQKLFLGKPAPISGECVTVLENTTSTSAPNRAEVSEPLLDFYAYDEPAKTKMKMTWQPITEPFRLTFILEQTPATSPGFEMHTILKKSAENAFSI